MYTCYVRMKTSNFNKAKTCESLLINYYQNITLNKEFISNLAECLLSPSSEACKNLPPCTEYVWVESTEEGIKYPQYWYTIRLKSVCNTDGKSLFERFFAPFEQWKKEK